MTEILLALMHGKNQNLHVRTDLLGLADRLNAPQVGHGDVEKNNIGRCLLHEVQQFQAVSHLADYFKGWFRFNDFLNAVPNQNMIISK